MWYGHYRSSSAFKGHNMRCSCEIFVRKGGRNRRLLLASRNCYFLCRGDNFGIEATRYVSTLRSYMCLKCLILNVSFSLALLSPQIFFSGTLTCAWRILIFSSKIMCNLFWFSRRSWGARQMWNPPPLTCCCWGQQQVSGGFLVFFFPYEFSFICSLFFVWFIRNHEESRTEGLTLCGQGQKEEAKELFKKEALRAASMTYISQKNIIFFKTNKKGKKESILSWSCSESLPSRFDRDRASIFIILKMPRNGVTIHARR